MDALHWFFVVLMGAMGAVSGYYVHLLKLKNAGMEMEAEGLRGKLKEAKSDVQFIQDQRDTYLSQVRGFAKIEAENKQFKETVEILTTNCALYRNKLEKIYEAMAIQLDDEGT